MKSIRPYLPWTLRILVAFLFLFSAYAKIYPSASFALPTFEAKQLVPLGFPEWLAPYFSRLMIALEFALGIGILQKHFLKRIIVPATIALLVIFCIHLSYGIATGVGGNCGCFGELLPMSPLQALIKNIITIGLLAWLFKMLPKDTPPHNLPLLGLMYTVPALYLFMIAPIQNTTSVSAANAVIVDDEPFVDTTSVLVLDTTVKVKTPTTDSTKPIAVEVPKDTSPKKVTSQFSKYVPASIKLDEGKKILCLFAPGCEHCQATAKILTRMRKEDPNFPKVYIIFMDEAPEEIPVFFAFAGSNYSYQIEDVGKFWSILGGTRDTPGVVYLWNGNIRYFSDGIDAKAFDEKALKKELAKEK